jgi:hypothetical protein
MGDLIFWGIMTMMAMTAIGVGVCTYVVSKVVLDLFFNDKE